MKKFILSLIVLIVILSCDTSTLPKVYTEPDLRGLTQPVELTGLWISEWRHQAGHTPTEFSPDSYAMVENPNCEYYYLLNLDGTGYYTERLMNITGLTGTIYGNSVIEINTINTLTYQVVTRDSITNTISTENKWQTKFKFFWGVDSNGKLKSFTENYEGTLDLRLSDYELNPVLPRCKLTRTIDKFEVTTELFINDIGSLKKVSVRGHNNLTAQYGF